MIRNFFVKNFLTNFPQNFINKLTPATIFRALKSEIAALHYSTVVTTKESNQKLSPDQLT